MDESLKRLDETTNFKKRRSKPSPQCSASAPSVQSLGFQTTHEEYLNGIHGQITRTQASVSPKSFLTYLTSPPLPSRAGGTREPLCAPLLVSDTTNDVQDERTPDNVLGSLCESRTRRPRVPSPIPAPKTLSSPEMCGPQARCRQQGPSRPGFLSDRYR